MNKVLRARLKAETADQHVTLENQLNLTNRWSHQKLLSVIRGFYGFYKPVEDYLCGLSTEPAGLYCTDRMKSANLIEDLRSLDVDPATVPLLSHDVLVGQGWSEPDRCWGLLYVIEGSTLGGQFLEAEIKQQVGRSSRFFSGFGAQTGARWKDFLEQLPGTEDSARLDEIVGGAKATFDLMASWMPREFALNP